MAAGNLARHALRLDAVGNYKASALADHLRLLAPHVVADVLDQDFAAALGSQVGSDYDVILDCTAENETLVEMARARWSTPKTFVSLSMGWGARRIIAVDVKAQRFPGDEVIAVLQPVVSAELAARGAEPAPREGVGCWSAVFPARHDAVVTAAAGVVDVIVNAVSNPSATPRLRYLQPAWQDVPILSNDAHP